MRHVTSAAILIALILGAMVPSSLLRQDTPESTFNQGNSFNFGNLPLSFEPNAGYADSAVQYIARTSNATLFFEQSGISMSLVVPETGTVIQNESLQREQSPFNKFQSALGLVPEVAHAQAETASEISIRKVTLEFVGSNPSTRLSGAELLTGKVNYFLGNDPSKWLTNIPIYSRITYADLYPGIDLTYVGEGSDLKGTYLVALGADPNHILWRYEGAKKVHLDAAGNLQLTLVNAANMDITLTEQAPVAWQVINGQKVIVGARYLIKETGTIGFALDKYDHSEPLTIDPTLEFSTYFGGNGLRPEYGSGIALDSTGNVYVTGVTESRNFATKNPIQGIFGGGEIDAFVLKLSTDGSTILFSTYLGGRGNEYGQPSIAVDAEGNALVAGSTNSSDFPVKNAYQPKPASNFGDAFVTKLSPDGSSLIYSTYLGGANFETVSGIAVDRESNVYVAGTTESLNFPVTSGSYETNFGNGLQKLFVTKMNSSGSALVYSTYFGSGSREEQLGDIAIDDAGNVYITGQTASTAFPLANAYQSVHKAVGNDFGLKARTAFVSKLNTAGSALVYSTYLGGTGVDGGASIAVDSGGNAYVVGRTISPDFPTTSPYQPRIGGQRDGFVTKLSASGSTLIYSTYLGGSGYDDMSDIAVDSAGNAFLTGGTDSANFPIANAYQQELRGPRDAFVSKLTPSGNTLIYSTYIGGTGADGGGGIAVVETGNAYVTGGTAPSDFPLVNALQKTYGGGNGDAFVLKFYSPPAGEPSPTPVATLAVPGTTQRTFPDTGKTVSGLFLDYWDTHGGLAQQGFPISSVLGEVSDLNGKPYTVQYFERAVFEYHPEFTAPNDVLLSQLGTFQYKKKYPNGAPNQTPDTGAGSLLFEQTGKRLGGVFYNYWVGHGGLPQQGYPISDPFWEKSDLDGKMYIVQYFERAVFELHPENAGTQYEVLLSQLGTFRYKEKYGGR